MLSISNPAAAWAALTIAGLLEIAWALGMKASDGFTRPGMTVFTILTAWLSFWLLGLATKVLPIGTAYAVWVAIGAIGVAIVGMAFLGEAATFARIACIVLIAAGVVGLKLIG